MTTPSTERKAGPLLGTGAQTTWPFTFKVFAATDIAVTIADSLGVETALVYGVDYNVTLNSNQETSPGGTVTYPISGAALPVGKRLVIIGNLPYDQPLDLPSGGNFSPLALENQLDRLAMQIQQLREQVGRAVQVTVTTSADVGLPPPAANELIGWDPTGQNLQNFALGELATAVAYATMRYDTFTGDGAETQFTLTADPVTLANLDVAIGGVTQTPSSDYSLVTGVLVFASAPPNGAEILARYGEGLVNVGGDSSDIRFLPAGTGAVATDVQTALREMAVSVKRFGTVSDSDAIQKAVNAAAAGAGNGIVFLPAGSYTLTTPIDLKGKYVRIIGAGETQTIVTAGASLTNMFDAEESSDIQISPFVLQSMTIDGNNTTTNGINIRYRHMFKLVDLVVQRCTNGIKEKDTWLGYHENVRSQINGTSWWLVGANHNSAYYRCSAIAFSTYGFKIESLGSALDGNTGLLFSACDVEFATGVGVYFSGTEATFDACYLGENVEGLIFDVRQGKLAIRNGIFFFGYTSSAYAFQLAAGKVTVTGTKIAGQGALGISGLAQSGGGKIKFVDVTTGFPVGGNPTLLGDVFDYGPAGRTFTARYGKNFTKNQYNNTVTATISVNSQTFTVATVTGSPSIMAANTPVVEKTEWQDGKLGCLVVVYSSNVSVSARLQGDTLGIGPLLSFGTLPDTGGAVVTAVKVDVYLDSAAYNILELYSEGATVGASFTLHEVFLTDASFTNQATLGEINNLYKC